MLQRGDLGAGTARRGTHGRCRDAAGDQARSAGPLYTRCHRGTYSTLRPSGGNYSYWLSRCFVSPILSPGQTRMRVVGVLSDQFVQLSYTWSNEDDNCFRIE